VLELRAWLALAPDTFGRLPWPNKQLRETAMAKQAKTLDDLFHDTLKDIYYAEKKILIALAWRSRAGSIETSRAMAKNLSMLHETEIDGLVQ
jgi:Domain of unknown function (DUF892)